MIGARSITSVRAERRNVTPTTPSFQNRCSTATSLTQACSGLRSGLPAVTTPVFSDESATKSSNDSCPTTRSKRRRTCVASVGAQVAASRGFRKFRLFSSATSPDEEIDEAS